MDGSGEMEEKRNSCRESCSKDVSLMKGCLLISTPQLCSLPKQKFCGKATFCTILETISKEFLEVLMFFGLLGIYLFTYYLKHFKYVFPWLRYG